MEDNMNIEEMQKSLNGLKRKQLINITLGAIMKLQYAQGLLDFIIAHTASKEDKDVLVKLRKELDLE